MMNKRELRHFFVKYNFDQKQIDEMAIPSYTHWNLIIRLVFSKRLRILKQMAVKGKVILDFGCEVGILFGQYVRSKKVYACDLHPQIAMEVAKILNFKINWINSIDDVNKKTLGLVVFADVLEHIENVDPFLEKNTKSNSGAVLVSLPTETRFYKNCKI